MITNEQFLPGNVNCSVSAGRGCETSKPVPNTDAPKTGLQQRQGCAHTVYAAANNCDSQSCHRRSSYIARASTACSSTFTPGIVRSSSMSSFSLWLMPPRQGVKIIAAGHTLAM